MLELKATGHKSAVLLSTVQFSLLGASTEQTSSKEEIYSPSGPKMATYAHLRKVFPDALMTRALQCDNDACFFIECQIDGDLRTHANDLLLAIDRTPNLVKSISHLGIIEAETTAPNPDRLKTWTFLSSASITAIIPSSAKMQELASLDGGRKAQIGKVIRLMDPRTPLVVSCYFDSLEDGFDFHTEFLGVLKGDFVPVATLI